MCLLRHLGSWSGWSKIFFLSGYMDCGLILGLTVISMFCCVPFWHRSGKFEVVVSSQCNFLKSIEFLFSKKKVDNQQTELTVNKNKYKSWSMLKLTYTEPGLASALFGGPNNHIITVYKQLSAICRVLMLSNSSRYVQLPLKSQTHSLIVMLIAIDGCSNWLTGCRFVQSYFLLEVSNRDI